MTNNMGVMCYGRLAKRLAIRQVSSVSKPMICKQINNQLIALILALLGMIGNAAAADQPAPGPVPALSAPVLTRLSVGHPQIVYPHARMPYTMDGSWATLALGGGRVMFFETDMGHKPYYFRYSGIAGDPLQKAEAPFAIDYNGYGHVWPGGCWINNIYKHTDHTLVGFCHREEYAPGNGRKDGGRNFFLGLAKSTDGGSNWKYLGDVIAPHGLNGHDPNIGGVPFLIVNHYVYLYFNEYDGSSTNNSRFLAVARASVDDMMSAVQAGRVPDFRKFSNGKWTEEGMTGLASEIIPGSRCHVGDWAEGVYDFHSDATYCKPLGRYLITVQTHTLNRLLLYSSVDGLRWQFGRVLDHAPGCMHPYSCFVGFDPSAADDGHEVGSKFTIFFPRKKLSDYNDDTLCRIECEVK